MRMRSAPGSRRSSAPARAAVARSAATSRAETVSSTVRVIRPVAGSSPQAVPAVRISASVAAARPASWSGVDLAVVGGGVGGCRQAEQQRGEQEQGEWETTHRTSMNSSLSIP